MSETLDRETALAAIRNVFVNRPEWPKSRQPMPRYSEYQRGVIAAEDAVAALPAVPQDGQVPQVDELLETLQDALNQACSGDDGLVDSSGLSAFADSLRLLTQHGLFDIDKEYGRRVVGRWNQAGLDALSARRTAVQK